LDFKTPWDIFIKSTKNDIVIFSIN
jgi:hypothetical protein